MPLCDRAAFGPATCGLTTAHKLQLGDGHMATKKKMAGKKETPVHKESTAKGAKPKTAKPKRVSGLDAAAAVLKDAGKPMTCPAIIEVIREKKMWTTTGKTPHATI